jgi:hypothetical protein
MLNKMLCLLAAPRERKECPWRRLGRQSCLVTFALDAETRLRLVGSAPAMPSTACGTMLLLRA